MVAESEGSVAPPWAHLAHSFFDQIQGSKGKPNGGGECRSLHRREDQVFSPQGSLGKLAMINLGQ